MRKTTRAALALTFAGFCHGAQAQFCPGAAPWVFDDVPAGDLFCGYITWAAQNGITLGCAIIDANHRLYCPNDAVTRSQMAAFVNRLGNVRVEAVGTGPGLTGGPITSAGTINLAATNLLPTTACANNQIARWNGSAWICSTDANSGGTVTSVGSGTGLTGGPVTSSGALSLATGYQLPQGCTNGQVAKSNGSNAWTCASDANAGGTVTSITAGNGLTGGTITTSGTIAVDPASATLTNNFFRQGGNAFGATAVLGTTDNHAIDIRVNGARVMRYEPNAVSPNVIGGHSANNVTAGVRGATIGGGGTGAVDPDFGVLDPNRVTDMYGTVAGGIGNIAGASDGDIKAQAFATVGGGLWNTASNIISTVSGGQAGIASGWGSVVGGGYSNAASGLFSIVGGGSWNTAGGQYSTVAGGSFNVASGDYSFAIGRRALTESAGVPHRGTFIFADSQDVDFRTTDNNEFAARAIGGVRFVTAIDGAGAPTRTVAINPNGELDFGAQPRQMLNLYGPALYGIGVQTGTLYFRTDTSPSSAFYGFSWYRGGSHDPAANNPGGGTELMRLATNGTLYVTGGTVGTLSDQASKEGFGIVDVSDVLAKVAQIPLATWSYKTNPGVRHIGPTAQDFHAAFRVGDDDARSISMVDADGVALAAIQGLNAKLEAKITEQARELALERRARLAQAQEIADLKTVHAAEIAELRTAVEVLMARTSAAGMVAAR